MFAALEQFLAQRSVDCVKF